MSTATLPIAATSSAADNDLAQFLVSSSIGKNSIDLPTATEELRLDKCEPAMKEQFHSKLLSLADPMRRPLLSNLRGAGNSRTIMPSINPPPFPNGSARFASSTVMPSSTTKGLLRYVPTACEMVQHRAADNRQ
jgi:hypothetical protein